MSKTLYLLIPVICFLLPRKAVATGDSTAYLTPKDTIFLRVDAHNENVKVFEHSIERKQTLYSLARFYGLSVEELYLYNPGLKDNVIQLGQAIRIPIPNRAIVRYAPVVSDTVQYIPVFYVVRQGDTMFRISRFFFRMPIDTLMQRNNLPDTQLHPGQLLHVGWMSTGGVPESYHQYTADPLTRRNSAMRDIYLRTTALTLLSKHQGVASWQPKSKEDLDFYALHRLAPLNSIIEVTNPMTERTVYVKVVGPIPDRAYGDDVIVVLSPLSAKALGAKDPRFFARVTYGK